ncbi:MAG TPA: hypothetical protein VHX87_04095 [Galbitalea sp.]|nr:hypothetical protein [Galbitalea sp.]
MFTSVRRSVASSAALGLAAVALAIVRNELDRLIGEVLSLDGHVNSLGEVTGLSAGTSTGSWAGWKSANAATSAQSFIAISTVFDLLFIACYAVLAYRLIDHTARLWSVAHPDAIPVSRLKASGVLIALVALNVLRDAAMLALDFMPASSAALTVGSIILAVLSYLTIAALVVFGLQLLLSSLIGEVVRPFLVIAIRAIYAQRLTAIVVFAVGALSLLPLANLFEQISDVYRGWVTFPTTEGFLPVFTGSAIATMVLDFVAFALTGLSLFALGRQRATHYEKLGEKDDRPDALYRGWFIFAGGVAIVAVVVGLVTGGASIDILIVCAFLAVVLAIPGVSAFIRWVMRGRSPSKPFLNTNLGSHARQVRTAGDLLVAIWIAIWVLGPFKALVSPLFLALGGQFAGSRFANSFWALLIFEVILIALGIGVPVLFRYLIARHSDSLLRREVSSSALIRRLAILALSLSIVGIAALLLQPATFAYLLGPVGSLVLLLGCWTTIIGTLIVAFGRSKPLALFQALKLRSTPIVTLLVVVPLVISFVDVPPTLHAIRATAGRTIAARPSVTSALKNWNSAQDDCVTQLPNGVSIRPLLLFAAQGGGIRAATWTVDVLRSLPGVNTCASGATFLSSGASGGSIGIATFRKAGNAIPHAKDVETLNYGGPDALATDIAGLLDGDLLGGVTGIRMPSPSNLTNPYSAPWAWHDRTALQELTWESEAPQFARPYEVSPNDPTGYDVFNSEDSVTNCKVIVSQLNLGATTNAPTGNSNCTGPGTELSNTIDLENYIGARCLADLNWSTAAELSARFPIISPPGRISSQTLPAGCLTKSRKDLDSMQLVDGGTADNSAIGTISDLAPELSAAISDYNAHQIGSASSPFVVPILVYASNDPGLDLTSAPNKTKPDALVPIAALQDAQAALVTPSAWLTRIANGLSQVCVNAPKACTHAVDGMRGLIPQGVVVASPSTEPAVSVPLGWSLSGFARTRLRLEAIAQAECGSAGLTPEKACRSNRGYGKLGTVLDLFRYPVQPAP